MATKDVVFCTIDVPNVETAAYIKGVLAPDIEHYGPGEGRVFELVDKCIQGGLKGLPNTVDEDAYDIFDKLNSLLEDVGAAPSQDSAPWLKPIAPDKIDGYKIDYRGKKGIKFGCDNQYALSLDQMREMVKKCEGTT